MTALDDDHEPTTAEMLYNADPDCDHVIELRWSGCGCTKCDGWFCY